MSRRLKLSCREIAVALVLTLAAGAFLLAALGEGSVRVNPVAAVEVRASN